MTGRTIAEVAQAAWIEGNPAADLFADLSDRTDEAEALQDELNSAITTLEEIKRAIDEGPKYRNTDAETLAQVMRLVCDRLAGHDWGAA
jgi:hypothetical protein